MPISYITLFWPYREACAKTFRLYVRRGNREVGAEKALYKLLNQMSLIKGGHAEFSTSLGGEAPIRHLSKLGLLDERAAIAALSDKLKIPYIDLDDPKIALRENAEKFANKVDPEMLWKARAVPVCESGRTITVAFANPLDLDTAKTLEFALGKSVTPAICEEVKITRMLLEHYPQTKLQFDTVSNETSTEKLEIVGINEKNLDVDGDDANTPPIVRLVNKILLDAIKEKASDIHIQPMQYAVDVRYRVDGIMQPILEVPKRLQPYLTSRLKLLAGMDISEKRRPQDGRMRVKQADCMVDMRVSALPTAYGETIVCRLLKTNADVITFPELGLTDAVYRGLMRVLNTDARMVLVTGPTGSGKTTTLYTALHYLKDGTSNIMTVEDPIEYRIAGINQVQVHEAAGVTFATALRSILRQDPDVIMVGEIRDGETAAIAVQAAQTGHKVLSTLHTNDAPSSITRLYDMGVQPIVLAASLGGILAQRLVRRICPDCADIYKGKEEAEVSKILERVELDPAQMKVGAGCAQCNFSGYKGRVGLYSFIEVNSVIEKLIASGAGLDQIEKEASQFDYRPLPLATLDLLKAGKTDIKEALPYLRLLMSEHKPTTQVVSITKPSPKPNIKPKQDVQPGGKIVKHKVLLVEDDHDVRSVMSMLLKREMYDVREAENGMDALELVYNEVPEIILCDLMMPVMDGKEFLSRLKGNEATSNIPVIMLTAADTEQNEVNLLDMGAVDFVSKASSSSVMLTRIRRALQGRS